MKLDDIFWDGCTDDAQNWLARVQNWLSEDDHMLKSYQLLKDFGLVLIGLYGLFFFVALLNSDYLGSIIASVVWIPVIFVYFLILSEVRENYIIGNTADSDGKPEEQESERWL